MKKILIPTKVYEVINNLIQITPEFTNKNEKIKLKIQKVLLELWFFIYYNQSNDNSINSLNDFTNIHSNHISHFKIILDKKILTYNNLIDLLISISLVERNDLYSSDRFSKSYRIITSYIGHSYTEIEIDFSKIEKNFKNKSFWYKKYPLYKKQIDDVYNVKIDLDSYFNWLINNKGLKLKPKSNKEGFIVNRYLTEDLIYDFINKAFMINYENIWIKISDEGRFYSSLTNMTSTALPFMKYKRRKMIEVDVRCCQPTLLCSFVSNKKFISDVYNGIFYEKLADSLGVDRDTAKILSYKYIFFSKKLTKSGFFYDNIESIYPNLINEINELKKENILSHLLQRLESDIFIKKISYIRFDMMLRHDAIFCYEEDKELIKMAIRNEFNNKGLLVYFK